MSIGATSSVAHVGTMTSMNTEEIRCMGVQESCVSMSPSHNPDLAQNSNKKKAKNEIGSECTTVTFPKMKKTAAWLLLVVAEAVELDSYLRA